MAHVDIKFHKSLLKSIKNGTKRTSLRLPDPKFKKGNTFDVGNQRFVITNEFTGSLGEICKAFFGVRLTDWATMQLSVQKYYPKTKVTYRTKITIIWFELEEKNTSV